MPILEDEMISRIKSQLRLNPKGMIISDLSHILKVNRNNMAKYLEILLMSGEVEMEMHGNAKVYSLSRRVPLPHFLNTSSDKIILLDKQGRIIWMNNAIRALLKTDSDDFIGKTLDSSGEPFLAHLPYHAIHDPDDLISEICVSFDGDLRYYRVKQTTTVLNDGEAGVLIQCDNITREKNFERMNELSEARYQAIVKDQTEYIVRFLPDRTLTFVNSTFASLMGKDATDLLGTPFNLEINEEDTRMFHSCLAQLSPEKSVKSFKCQSFSGTGIQHQQWTIRAFFDNIGTISEYQCIGRDISDQVAAEERLVSYASDMEFITRTTQEFLELPYEENLYEFIGSGLTELIPGAYIVVSSYEKQHSALIVKYLNNEKALEIFTEMTGRDIIGTRLNIKDPLLVEMMKRKSLERRQGRLYDCLFGEISYFVCEQVETALNVDAIYGLGMVSDGELLGNVAIFLQKGSRMNNPRLIEAFVHQASLVLGWRRAIDDLRSHAADLEFLSRKSQEFLELPSNGNLYAAIGDGLLELLPTAYICISSFDEERSSLTIRHICENEGIRTFKEITGRDILDYAFPIRDRDVLDSMRNKGLYKRNSGLFVALFGEIPYTQCKLIEEALNIEKLYSLGLVSNGQILGNIAIFPQKGDQISDTNLIEVYARQASLFLSWRKAEEYGQNHASNLEYLSRKTKELLEIPNEEEIYPAIADAMHELCPKGYISVSSFDDRTSTLTVRHVCDNHAIQVFREISGMECIGLSFVINDPKALETIKTNRFFKANEDLYAALFDQVPYPICKQIKERLGLEETYALTLTTGKDLLGNIAIFYQRGEKVANPMLVETFIQQASLVLALRKKEQISRRNE